VTLEQADEEGLLGSEDPESEPDRCEACGGLLKVANVTAVAYECDRCGAWFDHHLNRLRRTPTTEDPL